MPRLVVIQGPDKGKVFELSPGSTFIGRSSKSDIRLGDRRVSTRHLKVFQIGRKYFVEDLKSTNGTRVNHQRLISGEGFQMGEGDQIRLGKTLLRIEALPEPSAIETSVSTEKRPTPRRLSQAAADSNRRRSRNQGVRLIQNISRLLTQPLDLQGFCKKVLAYIMESLPRIDTAALVYLDPLQEKRQKRKTLVLYSSRPELRHHRGNVISEQVIDRVLKRGKTIRVLNAACEYSDDRPGSTGRLRIRSALCIPLISDSVVRGALYVHSTSNACGFRKEDLLTLNTISASLAVAFENLLPSAGLRAPLTAPH